MSGLTNRDSARRAALVRLSDVLTLRADKNEAGGAEFFEMYVGPITSMYSQVWWTGLPSVELPKDIVERFEGKGMAIVGYEVDQVRKKGDKDVDGSILQVRSQLILSLTLIPQQD
eukprot:SAG31_NODE_1732_length_7421_cov_10.241191_3_plen_115_part_00